MVQEVEVNPVGKVHSDSQSEHRARSQPHNGVGALDTRFRVSGEGRIGDSRREVADLAYGILAEVGGRESRHSRDYSRRAVVLVAHSSLREG